jgi:acyl-CoA synthetase (AMP-forming)/AMP-acid ligase II
MTVIREWIDAAAAREPDAAYLEEARGTGQLTYSDLQRSARTWALYLDRAGVPPGAHVAIRLPEPLGYAGALVAILGAGRVVVPLDPAAPPAALARMLEVARPVAVVAHGGSELPPSLPVLRPPEPGEADAPDTPGRALPAGGIFLCTSGTTGTPKGILLTENQLGHVAACVAAHHRLTPADRGYCCLPLFHVNAEVVGLLATLAARAGLVLDRSFSRRGFWAMIEEQRVTWINAVPAIITILAMEPSAVPSAVPPSSRVRFVRSASAPLPPSALRRFEEAFGIPVLETYGMTEAASMITANPLAGPRKPGSAGRPAAAEVRIAELAGEGYEPCPPGAVGRVQIRGPGVITGYAAGGTGVDGLAGAVGADGWLDTGDLGHLDSDGYLFLAGRSDDVINRGGEKIYPREIEDFLLAQPGVRSAAVVAARDEVLGERPVAYVVPAGEAAQLEETQLEGAQLEDAAQLEDTLRTACEAALPRPKRPTAFHLVRELPLGPTGKVTRGRLRELAATG